MEQGKTVTEDEGKKPKVSVIVSIGLIAASFLEACTGIGTTQPPTVTEAPPPPETSSVIKSPVVICSQPDEKHPNAVDMMVFDKIITKKNPTINITKQRLEGTYLTRPAADGGLNPFGGLVRTGLDGVSYPAGRVISRPGTEIIIYQNLEECLVDGGEIKPLHDFFNGVTSEQFLVPGPGGHGVKPGFMATTVNQRGKGRNPLAGRIQFPVAYRRG